MAHISYHKAQHTAITSIAYASFGPYLEGQGDLVSRLITPITHIVTLVIPIINLLTKSQ